MNVDRSLLQVVEEVSHAHFGDLDRRVLAGAIREVSDKYTGLRGRVSHSVGDRWALAARLRFFLPRDLPKVEVPLEELRIAGALPSRRTWRVLDLGAGLGATTLGAARFARRTGAADRLEVVAVDRDRQALAVFEDLARRAEQAGLVPIELAPHVGDVGSFEPGDFPSRHELILAGLVLNELTAEDDDRERAAAAGGDWLARWSRALDREGALVVVEPALRDTARRLQAVRDRFAADTDPPHVFAPCVRGGPCPMLEEPRHWCHTDIPGPLPEPIAALAREAGLRTERGTLSHLTLRVDSHNLSRAAAGMPGEPYRIVSAPLHSKGKLEVVGCGAAGLVRVMRLERLAGPANRALDRTHRGSIVTVAGPAAGGARLRLERGHEVRAVDSSSSTNT